MLKYSLYILGFIFIVTFIYQAYKVLKDVKHLKEFNYLKIFDKISEWYIFVDISRTKRNIDSDKLKLIEDGIDKLFETKVMKTSTLLFTDQFIAEYLYAKQHTDNIISDTKLFERVSRLDLEKTKQSLKIFSLAFGVKFSLDHYSFLNYWSMLKGNHTIFSNNRTDQFGRNYTWSDIEEPYDILVYYFENVIKKAIN
ncbi:MAG: hypothetical protein JXR69_03415 [Candidatus Delongbacteria bacterium]|nr:hypothetical protein [Candidatus Delongbacteria bacterium]